ncbi:mitochondrial ribosomal protein L37-domain-containing protein [Thelephora terrestris]|uniref:Large ribosomal subunit protein mL54 n=1 Tax=Thelephora terrestris TaxID=56493 RepID=A0A9P6HJR8_9AGAM|nr:mitochondrial ribosomal protein L37-domain-containing protein [Thelephora terrestris]
MSLLAAVRRQSAAFVCTPCRVRTYAAKSTTPSPTSLPPPETTYNGTSSCLPSTVLTGLNYLKGQPPVVALPDEDYPPWLWKLLEPKYLVDDGPGGKAEKVRLRKENRQRIRDQNLLKTQ